MQLIRSRLHLNAREFTRAARREATGVSATRDIASRAGVAVAAMLLWGLAPAAGLAEDGVGPERLVIELNAIEETEGGCALSFLVTNDLPNTIASMVLEAVLFDAGGQVERLTLFDFGTLPAGRPRVRQFVVPDASCEGFGSVLINGAQTCETGGAASGACEGALELRSRVGIDLIG